jgi:hypothetical protein
MFCQVRTCTQQAKTTIAVFSCPVKSSVTDDLKPVSAYDLCDQHVDLLEQIATTLYGVSSNNKV